MIIQRKKTHKIRIGTVYIGGDAPVAVQSMTKTDTRDVRSTVNQIKKLEKYGCEIIRVAVPDMESAKVLKKIKSKINIPIIADIHYDYKLALESINQGVDKIRINPGNIGSKNEVKEIIKYAKQSNIPIRIGLNSGSLPTKNPAHYSNISNLMVDTAIDYIKMFEDYGFTDIVVSLKATDVLSTIEAYQELSKKVDYPLHIGITESGPVFSGVIKSAVGLGLLLYSGIGDTIRVSLTAPPEVEVKSAYYILNTLGIRKTGIEIISCPTCSRCKINLIKIINEFENCISKNKLFLFNKKHHPVKVAIMGCEVNGPGEAKHADIGIAGGKNTGLFFRQGKPVCKIRPEYWITTLLKELEKI